MDDWHPLRTPEALRLRARLNALIRTFFAERGVLEVETPVLSRAGNTDPNIACFSLRVQRPHRRRAAHALAADLAGIRAQAPAGGRHRRLLRTGPRVPQRRGRRPPQPRIHDAGVVPRRLGPPPADGRKRGTGARRRWRLVGRDARIRRDISYPRAVPDTARHRSVRPPSEDELRAALGDVRIDPAGLTRDDWLDLLMTHRSAAVDSAATQLLARVRLPGVAMRAGAHPRRHGRRCPWPNASSCTWARWNWPTAITNCAMRASSASASSATSRAPQRVDRTRRRSTSACSRRWRRLAGLCRRGARRGPPADGDAGHGADRRRAGVRLRPRLTRLRTPAG